MRNLILCPYNFLIKLTKILPITLIVLNTVTENAGAQSLTTMTSNVTTAVAPHWVCDNTFAPKYGSLNVTYGSSSNFAYTKPIGTCVVYYYCLLANGQQLNKNIYYIEMEPQLEDTCDDKAAECGLDFLPTLPEPCDNV